MSVLEALAILEAATLECKKRNINTPEVNHALDFLGPYIRPAWIIPQFRHHVLTECTDNYIDREGQQQVLRATFPGIRNAVRGMIKVRMDALARRFHETHDMMLRDEISRLSRELIKLVEPWVFRVI
jgi:hypothetical protein